MKSKTTIILLFVFFFVSTKAQDTVKTATLDSVMVYGKQESLLEKTSYGDALDKKRLEVLNSNNVGEASKFLSGAMVRDYGGLGGVKTISIRGLSSNHTSILYDGVNIFDSQSGQVDLGKYSLSSVGSLSLANGQFTPSLPTASSLASASVISIETRRPDLGEKRNKAEFSLSGACYNTWEGDLFLAHRFSNAHILTGSFDIVSSDGDYPFVLHYGQAGRAKTEKLYRENNDIVSAHGEVNWFYNINRTNTLKTKFYAYYSDRGLPAAVTLYYMDSKERLKNANYFLQSTYTSYINGLFTYRNNFKVDWNSTKYDDPLRENGLGGEHSLYEQTLVYDNNALSFQPRENLFFTLTNDLCFNLLKSSGNDYDKPERFSSLSSFVADWRLWRYFYLCANVLHSYYKDFGGEVRDGKNHFSPYFSLTFKKGAYTGSLFYKNMFRMPTFNELYYRNYGDKNLKPEKSSQFSLSNGLEFELSGFEVLAECSLYYNDVKDKIVALPKNIYLWSMINYGKVKIYGLDVKLGVSGKIGKIGAELKLNYSFQHAADDEKSSPTYKNLLPYMPKNLYSIIASLQWRGFTLGYNCMLVDNRYSLPENISFNLLQHYADHNASLSFSHKYGAGEYSVSIGVKNIFDRQYEVIRSYPMMGRNFNIRIGVKI